MTKTNGKTLFGMGACVTVSLVGIVVFLATYTPPESEQKPFFTTTIDPVTRSVIEDPKIEALFREQNGTASVITGARDLLDTVVVTLRGTEWYNAVANPPVRYVKIYPGYRKEQVAAAFASQLHWDRAQEEQFLDSTERLSPYLKEGEFQPGTYVVSLGDGNLDLRTDISERFTKEVASRYATSTKNIIPLDITLTIASIIEREAGNKSEMRLISGIIWNRLFSGMKLQMDATLQYVKGTEEDGWWPRVVPNDKYLDSPYNTYQNQGLPPGAIANPSVNAVEAALNPKKTDCLFYFHDSRQKLHCSPTYAEHVTLLKKYYGTGK